MIDPTLPPNCTCVNCGVRFRQIPHVTAKRIRQLQPITCSQKCTWELKRTPMDKHDWANFETAQRFKAYLDGVERKNREYDDWMNSLDYEYQTAIRLRDGG